MSTNREYDLLCSPAAVYLGSRSLDLHWRLGTPRLPTELTFTGEYVRRVLGIYEKSFRLPSDFSGFISTYLEASFVIWAGLCRRERLTVRQKPSSGWRGVGPEPLPLSMPFEN